METYSITLPQIQESQMRDQFRYSFQAISSQLVESNYIKVPQVSAM